MTSVQIGFLCLFWSRHVIIIIIIIIIMYIYHALLNALSAHMIHSNLNMIFYTHVKHSPTKTIYIKYYLKIKNKNKIIIIKMCMYTVISGCSAHWVRSVLSGQPSKSKVF